MTRQQAASKGGKALVEKYGVDYMKKIGSKGGKRFHELYNYAPIGMNDFAIIERATGRVRPTTQLGKTLTQRDGVL